MLFYDPQKDYKNDHKITIGEMKTICEHCGEREWPAESLGLICLGGKINLPTIEDPPELLKNLLSQSTPAAKCFRRNLLKCNSAFQMTHVRVDKNMTDFGFLTTYKIQSQCAHLMGCLLPLPDRSYKFVQIYFMDGNQAEAKQRSTHVHSELELDIVV